MPELAKLLRVLRDYRTLREISDMTGIGMSYISDLENARTRTGDNPMKPSPEHLYRLAVAYGVPSRLLMEAAKATEEEIEQAEIMYGDGRGTCELERRIRDKVSTFDNTNKLRILELIDQIIDEETGATIP